jgi:hypothetical protein
VILNRKHIPWGLATVFITIVAGVLFGIYAFTEPNGPSGGSWQGMIFGVAGTVCMVYAGLFAGKKAAPKLPVGSAQTWLRGHIWIGFLSVPLILFHSGFRVGGLLEQWLLATFAIVILSGIYGLALQQVLPRLLTSVAPAQAIAAQVDVASAKLRQSIEIRLQKLCGATFLEPLSPEKNEIKFSPERELARFYWEQLAGFLDSQASPQHPLANPTVATTRLSRLKDIMPEQFRSVVEELRSACDERRQLFSQSRIHGWLHGWLCFHVPFSLTLLVLGILHVVMSLYY